MSLPKKLKNYLIDWPPDKKTDQKCFYETTHRISSPEQTLKRISPLKEIAGITRTSDITGLDYIGIPVYTATRPDIDCNYHNHVTIYNGKGLTKLQAKVSALMEALERFSAGSCDKKSGCHKKPVIVETMARLSRLHKVINPGQLILPEGKFYEANQAMEWVCGRELFSGEIRFIPACAAFYPYHPRYSAGSFKLFSDTNGIASGNSILEAISHGLAETIERDAHSIALNLNQGREIDLNSIKSDQIQDLIAKFQRAQINLSLKDISSEIGIPTFMAVTDDPITENPMLISQGVGTHPNAEIALMRAITEVAQSRCTIITGAREDLLRHHKTLKSEKIDYQSQLKKMSFFFKRDSSPKNLNKIPSIFNTHVSEDISYMLAELKRNGFEEVIVVNLTNPDLTLPVVRVIVPGLEPYFGSKRRSQRSKPKKKNWFFLKRNENPIKNELHKRHSNIEPDGFSWKAIDQNSTFAISEDFSSKLLITASFTFNSDTISETSTQGAINRIIKEALKAKQSSALEIDIKYDGQPPSLLQNQQEIFVRLFMELINHRPNSLDKLINEIGLTPFSLFQKWKSWIDYQYPNRELTRSFIYRTFDEFLYAKPNDSNSLHFKENSIKPLIFLGPSLDANIAKSILDADFLPPIRRGDLPKAISTGYRHIGIIDGVFHQSLSVSLREIAEALDRGVKVYGSSSMGALRAAEAYSVGMVGKGTVYQWYRSGQIEADDEVALCFDEFTGKALTEPLVNIRATLDKAIADGVLKKNLKEIIFQSVSEIYFPERNLGNIFGHLEQKLSKPQLDLVKKVFGERNVDLKAMDAQSLLHQMRQDFAHANV